jgi:hypothetical protein
VTDYDWHVHDARETLIVARFMEDWSYSYG